MPCIPEITNFCGKNLQFLPKTNTSGQGLGTQEGQGCGVQAADLAGYGEGVFGDDHEVAGIGRFGKARGEDIGPKGAIGEGLQEALGHAKGHLLPPNRVLEGCEVPMRTQKPG
jgi:hypothetical protein